VPLVAIAIALFALLALIALMPLSLVQRYRVGTARRLARGWVATLNLIALSISTALFLAGAAVTAIWVPGAFAYAAGGLGLGAVLGLAGLALSRWEATPSALHYTPNRWLVLAITLTVTARIGYGFWRAWQAWQAGVGDTSWLAAAGVSGSLAAGAVVLGYYFVYWAGVRRRVNKHRQMAVWPARQRPRPW
jgi:hypothetical protein